MILVTLGSSGYPSTFRSSRTPFYTSSNDHYFVYAWLSGGVAGIPLSLWDIVGPADCALL